jgi:UDP-glucose 4-epimerase
MRRVLVAGVGRHLGARLARSLADDAAIESVVGVDVAPPGMDLGRTRFVRADIRNPVMLRILEDHEIDTVVHAGVITTPASAGGRSVMKEINVIGTMQLLAACQKAPMLERLIVKSSTAVYGASSRDPALFTEETEPGDVPRSGFAKDSLEIESFVRAFGRRRPDVKITTLRFANALGPGMQTPLTALFELPVVPSLLGHDPRLQFVHEDDLVSALHHAVHASIPGVYNIAGSGVITLAQAARLAGRMVLPLPFPVASLTGSLLKRIGLVDLSAEQVAFLTYGRGVDTSQAVKTLGFHPRYTTKEAFLDFVHSRRMREGVKEGQVHHV